MESFSKRVTQLRNLFVVLLIGFLIGFVPMWFRARQRTRERDQAGYLLQKTELENQLSAAALDSRRGQHETARKELSQFFTSLDAAVNHDVDSTPAQLKSTQPIFSARDELITLLARNDPVSADRISDLDLAFRKALAAR